MDSKNQAMESAKKYIVLMALGGMLVLGIFLMLARPWNKTSDEESMKLTPVQKITTDNLDLYYPENPRLVAEKFCAIMKALYGESYSKEEFAVMVEQLTKLYDEEFLALQTDYAATMETDVSQKLTDGYTISNYVIPDSETEVTYFIQDNRNCAGMDVTFSVRNGTRTEEVPYTFIFRKEKDTGRWKILGWQISDSGQTNLIGKVN